MEKRFLIIVGLLASLVAKAQLPVVPAALNTSTFDPTQVSGLVMWVSANSGVTNNSDVSPPSDLDTVKGMKDLSGNGNFLLKLGGTTVQPTWHSTGGGSNSMPWINFTNSTAQSLTNNLSSTQGKAQPNIQFWVVCWADNPNNGAQFNAIADQAHGQLLQNSTTVSIYNNGLAAGCNCFQHAIISWEVTTIGWNGSSSFFRTNGVNVVLSSTTTGTLAQNGITLGNYFNSSNSGGVWFADFLWYSGNSMSAATMHQIETYLANKYALPIF